MNIDIHYIYNSHKTQIYKRCRARRKTILESVKKIYLKKGKKGFILRKMYLFFYLFSKIPLETKMHLAVQEPAPNLVPQVKLMKNISITTTTVSIIATAVKAQAIAAGNRIIFYDILILDARYEIIS